MQYTESYVPLATFSSEKVLNIVKSYQDAVNKVRKDTHNKLYGYAYEEVNRLEHLSAKAYTNEELAPLKKAAQEKYEASKETINFYYPGPLIVHNAVKEAGREFKYYKKNIANTIEYELEPNIRSEYDYIESERKSIYEERLTFNFPKEKLLHKRQVIIYIESRDKFKPVEEQNFKGFEDDPENLCIWLNKISGYGSGVPDSWKEDLQDELTKGFAKFYLLKIKTAFLVDRLAYLKKQLSSESQIDVFSPSSEIIPFATPRDIKEPTPKKVLAHTNEKKVYKSFDDLFKNKLVIPDCIDVLVQGDGNGENPVLNIQHKFIGIKGAFCIWIERLEFYDLIFHEPDKKIHSELLLKRFDGLDGFHPSNFRKDNTRANTMYKEAFTKKLSQISQKGKLGK